MARKARFGQVWWLVKPGLDNMVARKARFGQHGGS